MSNRRLLSLLLTCVLAQPLAAQTVRVVDPAGKPLPTAMVSVLPQKPAAVDTSDNGYAAHGAPQQGIFELHRYTDGQGAAAIEPLNVPWQVRLRKPGYKDRLLSADELAGGKAPLVMTPETDVAELAAQRPANAWAATVDFGDAELKKNWLLHCNFCHQQGSALLRRPRTAEEWKPVIERMVRYGARPADEIRHKLPQWLSDHWQKIAANPALVPEATPWSSQLAGVSVRELPIGDAMSQMHDLLFHSNGLIYVGDNLQDRLYEIDPKTGNYTVYKVPAFGSPHGGLLAGRLKDFPKHETYQGIHSLAESPRDGHIFITPSYQRRLLEFDPKTKAFSFHAMSEGFYPHTVRIDAKDRVWFTLALSNQVAMFDRVSGQFRYYDLPFRSLGEKLTTWAMPWSFKLMSWGVPVANWVSIDRQSTGVPLPYGIDIAPDGTIWFARLYADDIGVIDPESGRVEMIPTPFHAPRRLRADRDGNLWIVAFTESQIAKYDPKAKRFTRYDLPVVPKGSETPYSLNVDRKRHVVWVNGTNSDSVFRFDIASEQWLMVPLSRKVTFTRDVEFSPDGKAYISGASFPAWHIEDGHPTLMEVSAPR
jgi:streptogramin lyase